MSFVNTNLYKNLLRDGSKGASSTKVTYVAIGSGTSTPTASQTSLDSESMRKLVTSYTDAGTGTEYISLYLSPADAVGFNIQEVAIYGNGATNVPNSGTMLARALYAHNPKLDTESIIIQAQLQFL